MSRMYSIKFSKKSSKKYKKLTTNNKELEDRIKLALFVLS